MREPGQNLDLVKKRVELLRGTPVLLKVNEGRNKINCYLGAVEEIYPSVFLRLNDEKVKTFRTAKCRPKR